MRTETFEFLLYPVHCVKRRKEHWMMAVVYPAKDSNKGHLSIMDPYQTEILTSISFLSAETWENLTGFLKTSGLIQEGFTHDQRNMS